MQAGEGRGLLELLGGRQLDQHAGRPAPLRWQAQVVRQVHGVVERLGTPTNRPIRCADLTLNSVYTCLGASHGTRLGRFIRGEVKLSADVKGGQNATLRLCRGALVFTSLIKELPTFRALASEAFHPRVRFSLSRVVHSPYLLELRFRGLPPPCSCLGRAAAVRAWCAVRAVRGGRAVRAARCLRSGRPAGRGAEDAAARKTVLRHAREDLASRRSGRCEQ